MMYRDNTAYDFEMFSPKKKVVELPVSASSKKRTSSAKKTVAQPAKGNIFKGPFHIPRMMIKSFELCNELTK